MDRDAILFLLERFERSLLSEMKVKFQDWELHMKKGAPEVLSAPPSREAHPVVHAPSVQQAGDGTEVIVSPMVGTFYRAPAPDAPPFVEEGIGVKKGDTLCILEALKLMNELEAEYDCRIVEILAESGTMVQFGTPLFRVARS